MNYVIDKATNRVVYPVPDGGRMIIDEHSYCLEAEPYEFVQASHKYRWNQVTAAFDYAPDAKPVSTYPMPTVAPPPLGIFMQETSTPTMSDSILDTESWEKFQKSLENSAPYSTKDST